METLFYLAQSYSKYHCETLLGHPAFMKALECVKDLWQFGIDVFSPILYTHPFHICHGKPNINYVQKDLNLIQIWKRAGIKVVGLFVDDCLKQTPDGCWHIDPTQSSGAYEEWKMIVGDITHTNIIVNVIRYDELIRFLKSGKEISHAIGACSPILDVDTWRS